MLRVAVSESLNSRTKSYLGLRVVVMPSHELPDIGRPFQEWNADEGTPSAQFFRTENGYLIRFPGLADFSVPRDGVQVTCT